MNFAEQYLTDITKQYGSMFMTDDGLVDIKDEKNYHHEAMSAQEYEENYRPEDNGRPVADTIDFDGIQVPF